MSGWGEIGGDVSAALMVTVVEALLGLATGPVQPANW